MKIEWNWGTKLLIWIIAFILFILGLVFMTTKSDVNLVEKDYYPKGLVYQQRIDAIENAKEINAVFKTIQNTSTITLNIPDIQIDEGAVTFFRPSGNSLDRVYDFVINKERIMTFPKSDLKKGKYLLKINWNHENKEYYVEQVLFVK